jgi:hypothetical protein
MQDIYQTKQDKKRFYPYIFPIAFPLFFPLGFGLAVLLGYINMPIMLILSAICTLLLVKEQSLIGDNQNRIRFFPHIFPIAFPLVFPLSFAVSVALVHLLPPALVPAFAVVLIITLVFVEGLQLVVIIWTFVLWLWSILLSIAKMCTQLMQLFSPQPEQSYCHSSSQAEQEQSYYPPQEQIQ